MAGVTARAWFRGVDAALCVLVLGGGIGAVALHEDEPEGPCGPLQSEPLRAREILDCLSADLAHITTPEAAGSAILLPDGRLVTNAHVVDPFTTVDVTFGDGEAFEAVAVVGVDLQRDIAVLGPIDREGHLRMADAEELDAVEQGDDVFLVGYPGEIDEGSKDPTISSGIVSQVRDAERFEQTFLQTDAAIGGGQSGGALVDGNGIVLGISGLSFAENFALALSSPDVEVALDRIADGQGSAYHPIGGGASTTGVIDVPPGDELVLVGIPSAGTAQSIRVELTGEVRPFFTIQDNFGDYLWVPPTALARGSAEEFDMDQATYDRLVASSGSDDQVAEFTLPADRYATLLVGTIDGSAAAVNFNASVPVSVHPDTDDGNPLAVGSRFEGVIDAFEFQDTYTVDLTAGQAVEVYLGAVAGDMIYWIYPVGGDSNDDNQVDDSGEGLYGLDANETFTAPADGTYVIEVATYESISIGYVLEIQPA